MNYNELQPSRVWHYFSAISQIPRESGNEKAVSDYLYNAISQMGIKAMQEPCGNVIAYKPASAGYEQSKTVILQGHMDMVCVKNDDSQHNFETDPIELIVDGDLLKANGTTLGADNGIAVAMAMAILEDNSLSHPALTVLFTTSEETGMDGAIALDPANLPGDMLINLDSEEEGYLLTSNAGGANVDLHLPIDWVNASYDNFYQIGIEGLKGGHSGVEIDKMRANAIKLMGRLLKQLNPDNYQISAIAGGEKMNAIANSCSVKISTAANVEAMLASLEPIEKTFKAEFAVADPDLKIVFQRCEQTVKVFSRQTADALIDALLLLPQGVQTMSQSIDGLVESSNNIGVISQDEVKITIVNALRSSVASLKELICTQMFAIADLVKATPERYADYPEWSYRIDSPLRDKMLEVYRDMYGKDMIVQAIHAGLECGLFAEKMPDLDMVSIGPDMWDVHSPRERLSIASTERTYQYLLEVLKNLKL
ncbi:MAG: aminoacyl-histidine dipeptidase [Clostridiales bacterium]|nr:MAG: aminoacyl-histidine dipeptidase [Clostridiales bacterium]